MNAPLIEIVTDPFPSDADMRRLWLAAWGSDGPPSFVPLLSRSLGHVGAFADGQLVGFVNVAWDGGVHAFILDTCVDPAMRRQGLGLALVERAVALARERGAHWLHVDFEPQYESFYRKCGFGPTTAGVMRLN